MEEDRPFRFFCWHCNLSVVSFAHPLLVQIDQPNAQRIRLYEIFLEKHEIMECDVNPDLPERLEADESYFVDRFKWPALHYGRLLKEGTTRFLPESYKEHRLDEDE